MRNKKKQAVFDKQNQRYITYQSKKEMEKQHPDGNYLVIGEIEKNNKPAKKEGITKEVGEQEVTMYPIGTYPEKRYQTIGYVPCNDKEYLAVKQRKYNHFLFILAVLLLFFVGYYFFNQKLVTDIDPQAEDYLSQLKRPENIDDSKILIPGYGTFTLTKGSDTIDTVLFNPEDNPCFFKFTLTDKETGERLYESKLVAPGKGISPIKLMKSFTETGTHEAVLLFQTFDLEDTDIAYNSSNIDVKINVVD